MTELVDVMMSLMVTRDVEVHRRDLCCPSGLLDDVTPLWYPDVAETMLRRYDDVTPLVTRDTSEERFCIQIIIFFSCFTSGVVYNDDTRVHDFSLRTP